MRSLLRFIPSGRSFVWLFMVLAVAFVLSLKYSEQGGEVVEAREVEELVTDPGCNPVRGFCGAAKDSVSLRLHLGPEVVPMRPFPIRVEVAGLPSERVESVQVEFVMLGMDMGQNRYSLMPAANGTWEGLVTLPICTSSRVDWQATVRASTDGRTYFATFPFEAS